MSKKNYNNYSKKPYNPEQKVQPVVDEPVVEEAEVAVEQMVTESEMAVEPVIEKEEVIPAKKIGVVTDCEKLNVRTEPGVEADIECVIKAGTEVEIDDDKSTKNFYKVCLASGIEGYCMKQFVEIRQ